MRYHKDIGFPSNFVPPRHSIALHYTKHADYQARVKNVTRYARVNVVNADLFEIVIENGRVVKYGIRIPGTTNDTILIITPNGNVITTWTNSCNDTHRSLNVKLYDRP